MLSRERDITEVLITREVVTKLSDTLGVLASMDGVWVTTAGMPFEETGIIGGHVNNALLLVSHPNDGPSSLQCLKHGKSIMQLYVNALRDGKCSTLALKTLKWSGHSSLSHAGLALGPACTSENTILLNWDLNLINSV